MDALLRLLELLRRELRAKDAYLRLGGPPASDPGTLTHELRSGCHLVVVLDAVPEDRAAALRRLTELAQVFTGTVGDAIEVLDTNLTLPRGDGLTQVLADLRDATAAEVAVVVDRQSPVIWGCSEPGLPLPDRPTARRLASAFDALTARGLDPIEVAAAPEASEIPEAGPLEHARRAVLEAERERPGAAGRLVLAARAITQLEQPSGPPVQPQGPREPGVAIKEIAGLYQVVLVFGSEYSPLRVEGVMRRALPVIERHVLELPPLDPTPRQGRVVPLRRD